MTYPFSGEKSLVRNRWYIACTGSELADGPIERTILGVPVVLYRTEAGEAVAMYGICPHRYYPLALGKVFGDAIACGYHGFRFGSDGKCVLVPSQKTGAGFIQPTYPTIERGPFVWMWAGDRERCDPALMPDLSVIGLGEADWVHTEVSRLPIDGRSQLLVDNLMDLTHLPYVHAQLPGGEAYIAPVQTGRTEKWGYSVSRDWTQSFDGFLEVLFGADARFEGQCHIHTYTAFFGPELVGTSGPVITAIEGHDCVPDTFGTLWFIHGITPETEHSTHYWSTTVRNFRRNDPHLDQMITGFDTEVRQQDVLAIGQVERRLEVSAGLQKELLARSDAPAVAVRQIVQGMIDAD